MKGILPGYKKCFFCGPATGGLELELQYADGKVVCDFTPNERFQGYAGMLHGGIVCGLLDEVMWWVLYADTRRLFATWKIEVEFKRPVACGLVHRASARVVESTHRTVHVEGIIEDSSGKLCAKGMGYFREMKSLNLSEFVQYLDFRGVSPEMHSLFHVPGAPSP
ncbi:MAG: PaaI family thioesterase [Chitinivibrionia bacterium]|nr:PaaI family thioesterase [Chitinivibrionia bacterium]